MAAIALLLTIPIVLGVGLLAMAAKEKRYKTYRLSFPPDLDADRVVAFLRSITGTLHTSGPSRLLGVPTVALEVWATDQGITHRIKIPWSYEERIKPKLESHIQGIRLIPEDEPPTRVWVHGVEAGLKNSDRSLRVYAASEMAVTVLSNFGAMHSGETLMMQWVISPATPTHPPIHNQAKTSETGLYALLHGDMANRDEVNDRRSKLEEPNMMAVLRVGAVASTPIRAQYLVRGLMTSLDSARGPATFFYKRLTVGRQSLQRRIESANAVTFPVQLSSTELASVIAWPIGNPLVNGLPAPVSRYIPASMSVPSAGRVIGLSTYPGTERKIAVSYKEARKHMHIIGPTGVGKSVLIANMAKQDMEQGYGLVLIDQKDGELFKSVLDYVPPGRMNDVIVFDVADKTKPIAFNILDQGNPAVVINELVSVFNNYFGTNPSLWMHEVMSNGLHTLATVPGATFADLASLVRPLHEEVIWRDNIIRGIRDPQLRDFWTRFDNETPSKRDEHAKPLLTRIFPMMRETLRNIIGQPKSSFQMADVMRNNKILLVNLSGIDPDAAALMGTLLVNATWHAAQTTPISKGTFLYLDEFADIMKLPVDPGDMLAKARGYGLGMVLAHQDMGQLTNEMASAVMSNARTKVVFQTSNRDAAPLAREFGSSVTAEDFQRLPAYQAIARVSTDEGISPPLTLATYSAARGYGLGQQLRYLSREAYGRNAQTVEREMRERRNLDKPTRGKGPNVRDDDWGL